MSIEILGLLGWFILVFLVGVGCGASSTTKKKDDGGVFYLDKDNRTMDINLNVRFGEIEMVYDVSQLNMQDDGKIEAGKSTAEKEQITTA